jgi:hypothetical protein
MERRKFYPIITCWSYVREFYINSKLLKVICLEGPRIWFEALRYNPEGREFDSRLCHWTWPHYCHRADSALNGNEYQEYFLGDKSGRCLGLTTLPPSCADCLEIWKHQTPGTPHALSMPVMGLIYCNLSWSQLIVYEILNFGVGEVREKTFCSVSQLISFLCDTECLS